GVARAERRGVDEDDVLLAPPGGADLALGVLVAAGPALGRVAAAVGAAGAVVLALAGQQRRLRDRGQQAAQTVGGQRGRRILRRRRGGGDEVGAGRMQKRSGELLAGL